MTATIKRTASKSKSCRRHRKRRKSIFNSLSHSRQNWSRPCVHYHQLRINTVALLKTTAFSDHYLSSRHSSPQPSHTHTPPLHTLHTPPTRTPHHPKTLLQQLNSDKRMAHASPRKYRSREDSSVLPLYNLHTRLQDHDKPPPLKVESVTPLYVLCIPLHKLSRHLQFLVCVAGVLFFYLLYGYTQEWIFSVEGFKPFGWYLTMVQFAFYSLFGFSERKLRNEGRRRIPLSTYAFLAFLIVSTMGLSNTSLGYLNYPTQVIFKSCKLIPVMIGGILIQGKRYTFVDGIALLCMSVGLIMFTLADSTMQPEFNKTGVLLISLALCADAVIGNVQEKALKQYSAPNLEMVLFSYFIGFWYILVGLLLSGALLPALYYCMEHPEMYLMAGVFSLTGYLGINFVLVLVRSFGALLAVTVTTFRKAVTMVLSFLLFTKPFTVQYVWAGLVVLLGILINLYSKNRSKVNAWIGSHVTKLRLNYIFRNRRYLNSSFQV